MSVNQSSEPALISKKGKTAKVYTLRQLCSQRFHMEQPDLVHTPTKLFDRGDKLGGSSEFFSGGFLSPKSSETLEGWLQEAFREQQIAVAQALQVRQQWMMQQLLGKLDVVSPTNRSSSGTDATPLRVPAAQVSTRLNSRGSSRERGMDPVEPQAPPLPPFPPLPNQLPNHLSESDPVQGAKSTEIMSLEIPRAGGRNRMGAKPDVLKIDDEDDDLLATQVSKDSIANSGCSGSKSPTVSGRPSQSMGPSRADGAKLFRRADDFLDQLKMPFWHPGRIVKTTQFDAFICAVIMLNTLVMAFESQYLGLQRGYDLGYPRFTQPASEEWPLADLGFFMLDWVFGVIYFLEIIIKISGLKICGFIKDPWNWFDTSLVMFWLVEKTLSAYAQLDQGLLRVLRMGRVLRLLRLVKTIQGFDALYIMTTAMQGSVTVLFWSFVLLMVVQTLIAFTLNQALDSYFKDKTKPVNEQHQVFEYFGTAGRAMFTMFELTLANWPTAARILQENVTEYYGIFSVAYKLIIGFAAVGIINAVFMQETFKVAASDDKLMMRQKERDRMLHTKKMRTLFAAADESGDGVLDQDEFREIMNSPDIRMWLAAQELPVRDPDVLWKLLDDGDAELTADELVAGVDRLKGTAKGIDLAAFMMQTREFQIKICQKLGIEMEEEGEEEDDDD